MAIWLSVCLASGPTAAERPLGRPPLPGVILHAEAVRLAVRPNGTELKLKPYLQVVLPVAVGHADTTRARAQTEVSALLEQAEGLVAQ